MISYNKLAGELLNLMLPMKARGHGMALRHENHEKHVFSQSPQPEDYCLQEMAKFEKIVFLVLSIEVSLEIQRILDTENGIFSFFLESSIFLEE